MKPTLVRRVRALLAVTVLLAGLSVPGQTAAAARTGVADAGRCVGSTVGWRLPVLLVHGFNSASTAWKTALTSLGADRSTCVDTFDYGPESTSWVTDSRIGPALAGRIVAMAAASKAAGGPGEVVVVAHSMGGLALRCAADAACSQGQGGAPVVQSVRAVITFDTPHRGTQLKAYGLSLVADPLGWYTSAVCSIGLPGHGAGLPGIGPEFAVPGFCTEAEALFSSDAGKAFTPGSGQLQALAAMPRALPELAVAGQFTLSTSVFGKFRTVLLHDGDLVVSQDSAQTFAYTHDGLGGKAQIDCGGLDLGLPPALALLGLRGSCWHGTETGDSRFLAQAAAQIKRVEALDDVRPPVPVATDDSFGPVKLGMTAAQVQAATGVTPQIGYNCIDLLYRVPGASDTADALAVKPDGDPDPPSLDETVEHIGTPPGTLTDRGVGDGSTIEQVMKAYSDRNSVVQETQAGQSLVVTTGDPDDAGSGNPGKLLGFQVNDDGRTVGPPFIGGVPGYEYCSG